MATFHPGEGMVQPTMLIREVKTTQERVNPKRKGVLLLYLSEITPKPGIERATNSIEAELARDTKMSSLPLSTVIQREK